MKSQLALIIRSILPIQRPSWLPSYIPELQGLRGIAVLSVVLYHCHPRLAGTWFYGASLWGWAGVNLFFVLSGFLITSILLEARGKPHYFRNFYGRRALRIWPVYVLVLVVCYLNAPWFIGPTVWDAFRTAPWWAYLLFLQNLFHLALPPAIGPTWSLAIEEQYYFLWAPVVRLLRAPWMLAILLIAALIASPLFRDDPLRLDDADAHAHAHRWHRHGQPARARLYTLAAQPPRLALRSDLPPCLSGFIAAATIAGGTAFLDTALTTLFAGAVLVLDRLYRSTQPRQCDPQPRPAGLLRPHQLRPLHDTHHGLRLLRLVRCPHGPLRHARKPGRRRLPSRRLHTRRHTALVRIRIENSAPQATLRKRSRTKVSGRCTEPEMRAPHLEVEQSHFVRHLSRL